MASVQSFIGSIDFVGFPLPMQDWATCSGEVLPIAQNEALYSLIGTFYWGGDGNVTFALPDLQGRVPVGVGQGVGLSEYELGEKAGAETFGAAASGAATAGFLGLTALIALEGVFPDFH